MAHVNLTPFFAQLGRGFNLFNPNRNFGLVPTFTGDKDPSGTSQGLAAGKPSASSLPAPIQIGPESSGKILDRQVISSLENTLQSNGIALSALGDEDFSPDAVAGRVITAVQGFLEQFQQENPDAATDDFFAQVREGVERGFAEARDALSSLGVLAGDVAEDIDETYTLIQQGLDRLQNPVPTPAPGPTDGNTVVTSASQALFASIEQSQSTSIQIETREGDIVTIDIFKNASADTTIAAAVAADGSSAAFAEHNVSASAALSFSVQGDLNKDELKAIGKLLGRIDKVADKFFDGNIDAALKKAGKLGFDTKQLASFSVDLQQSRSVQVAAAYQQTTETSVPTIGDAVNFISDFENLLNDDTAKELFADPFKAVGDLFKGVAENKSINGLLHDLDEDIDDALENVVDELTGLFKGLTGLETESKDHDEDDHDHAVNIEGPADEGDEEDD